MSRFYQVKAYINHWLDKVDEHSVHSPFFFDLYRRVVRTRHDDGEFVAIEKIRKDLFLTQTEIVVEDLGAGSSVHKGNKRRLSEISAVSVMPSEWAQLIYRLATYCESTRIIELGTSLGITSLYLSEVSDATVYTFEGSHAIANVALTNFEYLDRKNIHLIEGNIDTTLAIYLEDNLTKVGLVLIDANHRYESTVRYFGMLMKRCNEKSVIVIDDIHLSSEMEKAWRELKEHSLVYGSVDLFRYGVLFFDPALNKQHFVWTL